ncbi:hypothetical protein [Fangia hongkongensis]|uniref:hypothetical protein n=1 Tax=Fangia hongkongensis TaxID=270495 RepID=UPI001902E823|nr:hypothetical protein [Fangia hongkongensis]
MKYTFRSILLASILLSGCSLNMKATEDQANHNIQHTTKIVDQATTRPQDSLVHFDNSIFVSDKAFKVKAAKEPLPPVFNEKFVFNSNKPMTLSAINNDISLQSGLPIRMSEDAVNYLTNGDQKNAKSTTQNNNLPPISANTDKLQKSNIPTMYLHYVGTLKELLDQITSKFNLSWRYDHESNQIEIFRFETKTFRVGIVSGKAISKTVIKNGDTSSLSPQVNSLSIESGEVDEWKVLSEGINRIIGDNGSLTALPTAGYVSVTTTPKLMNRVESLITQINKVAEKNVAVQVDIYDIQQTNSSNYGLDWNLVMKASSSVFNWDTRGIADALSNPLSSTTQTATISAGLTGGALSGSQLVLNALQSIGKITSHKRQMAYTMSGQATQLDMSTQTAYVEKSDVTVQTGSGSDYVQTSITPATINTGFNMKMTPFINPNNKILLRMAVIMGNLDSMRREKTGTKDAEGYVELPSVSSKTFAYVAKLNSGQALIIAAFNDDTANMQQNSIGGEDTWALGGKKGTAKSRSMTVVVVTPYIIGDH